jgi:dihydrolipoamide dehydrogenase
VSAKHVILSHRLEPAPAARAAFDEDRILSNDGALRIGGVAEDAGRCGSGVIGLEMGSVWRRLGAEVTGARSAAGLAWHGR